MSFDLGVFHVDSPISSSEAAEIYVQLCEGNVDVVNPSENIDSFVQELTSQYPQIDDYSDEDVDDCPWSTSFDISDGSVVMPMVWSRVEEVAPVVMRLAAKYDLACYDPQEDRVILPPSLSRRE